MFKFDVCILARLFFFVVVVVVRLLMPMVCVPYKKNALDLQPEIISGMVQISDSVYVNGIRIQMKFECRHGEIVSNVLLHLGLHQ